MRHRENFFNRPSPIDSMPSGRLSQVEMFTQSSNAAGNSENRKHSIRSRVSGLMHKGGPTDVGKLIVTVVINAFERPSFLSFANIGKEVFKRLPAFADRNPSCSVGLVMAVLFVFAPLAHSFPNAVNSSVGHSVGEISLDGCLSDEASARPRSSTFQWSVSDDAGVTALAHTEALRVPFSIPVKVIRAGSDYFKLSEGQSDERFLGRHSIGSFFALFSCGRSATTGAHGDYPPSPHFNTRIYAM